MRAHRRQRQNRAEQAQSSQEALLASLRHVSEQHLTRYVILPLIRAMYPDSRLEETHGADEAGRDVVCRTTHARLRRPWILCVQVKNHRITTGTSGPYSLLTIKNQVERAKKTG